jgi:hypothetical protein
MTRSASYVPISHHLINHLTLYFKKLNIGFANSAWICTFVPGELAEWSIAAVLKTVELLPVPGVRIPSSPLITLTKVSKAP